MTDAKASGKNAPGMPSTEAECQRKAKEAFERGIIEFPVHVIEEAVCADLEHHPFTIRSLQQINRTE